jgi:RimJ/RimL family protein N-acetyltransferase
LLERNGFALARETRRFEWRNVHEMAGVTPARMPARLILRALEEVGADAFVAAIARVTDGTLDRRLRQRQEQLGPAGAARELFELVQALGYEPGWWQLAYTTTGEFAGLIMPAKGGGEGEAFIGYIGVTPEQRGHGYAGELLAQATALLQASGVTTIAADTDTGNTPMANAFRGVGYIQFATRCEYFLDPTRGRAGL